MPWLPLVQALADGETIQLLSGKEWIDLTDFRMGETPELYRVKPKPKMSWCMVAEMKTYTTLAGNGLGQATEKSVEDSCRICYFFLPAGAAAPAFGRLLP